ncbi:MAG: metallophosphoesterase [Abditibacteriota bacterium]|nr:metallophosphoesterase [Abditibacteriota bacterium]
MRKLIITTILAVTAITAGQCADKTIAEWHPDFESTLLSARKQSRGTPGHIPALTLYFMSDVHSDGESFARHLEFCNTYEKYFDGIFCAGDIVLDDMNSDFTYWTKTPGHEKVMIAIGNHDTLRDHKGWTTGPSVWENQMTMAEAYNKYFAPFIDKWDVVYQPGKTYYYKDFDAQKTRLIVLDSMLKLKKEPKAAAGQIAWFKTALAGAREKDYSVIAAAHIPMNDLGNVKCNFTEFGPMTGNEYEGDFFPRAVDEFMKEGGKFVCWLHGHIHQDLVQRSKTYPKQLAVAVANVSADPNLNPILDRTYGTRNRDIADVFMADTTRRTIKITRIGANVDCYLRPRNGICIDYGTGEIVSQY